MKNLSFEHVPHYIFSSNRQFEAGEKHISRIYDQSVLILMRRGTLYFNENGISIELNPGEYYIQRPNLLQEGIKASLKPNYYFIHFRGFYSEGGALPLRGHFDIDKVQKLIDRLDEIGDTSEKIEKEELFYRILLELKNSSGPLSNPEKIRQYIIKNMSKDIKISDLGKALNLSKNQIINVFKNKYGLTPHQFLIKIRLKKASEMIISTNQSVKEICYSLGFSDYSNFYKSFVVEFKESPIDYRNKMSSKKLPKNLYKFPKKESGVTLEK